MAIRKNVVVFMGGSLQKVDLDEKGHVVKSGAPQPKEKDEAPAKVTKQGLMAELKEKGIAFKATLSNAALQEILAEHANRDACEGSGEEPCADGSPGESVGGTGNQDVI